MFEGPTGKPIYKEGIAEYNGKKREVFYKLLRYGYIDESYMSYINFFYTSSISKRDLRFIQNIKRGKYPMGYSYKLDNPEGLVASMSSDSWLSKNIIQKWYVKVRYYIKNT